MKTRDGYKASEVAKILGTSKRTIQLYGNARTGAVHPDIDSGAGRGTTRLFSRRNVFEFALCKRLIESGVKPSSTPYVIRKLRERFPGDLPDNSPWGVVVMDKHGDLPDVKCLMPEPTKPGGNIPTEIFSLPEAEYTGGARTKPFLIVENGKNLLIPGSISSSALVVLIECSTIWREIGI